VVTFTIIFYKYKRTIAARAIKKTIPSLLHPTTKVEAHSPAELDSAVSTFYRELYTTQPISTPDVEQLISTILPEDRISISVHDRLQRPFTMSEISEGTNRCPNKSSPGKDGLPYEILSLLLTRVATAQLALQIYNDALQLAIFPASWCSTCVCLLPKKGDLKELRNWRPISLINTDAKVFTRLLNARLMPQFANKISRQQLGFMPNRFIAEHGLQLSTIKMIAQHQKSQSIALMLDQEKAYDRIHPEYLASTMKQFGIPHTLIQSIITLFFFH
jgi:hypothetical protein